MDSNNNEQGVLDLQHVILMQEEDRVSSLYELVDQLRRKMIQFPEHQRASVWEPEKKDSFIARIKEGKRLIGSFCTYQVDNGFPSPIFINDGRQRSQAALDYLNDPQRYGDTASTAELCLRRASILIQHRLYKSHDEAMLDFQRVNMGTHLTLYEFFRGILAYAIGWPGYEPIIDDFHQYVREKSGVVVSSRDDTRTARHKYMRHDYLLIYRFLDPKSSLQIDLGGKTATIKHFESTKSIERNLRALLDSMSLEQFTQSIDQLKKLIERTTALLETLWHADLGYPIGQGMGYTTFRWILEFVVYHKGQGRTNQDIEDFLYKLLLSCGGKSQVAKLSDQGSIEIYRALGLGRLAGLGEVCEIIDSDFYVPDPRRRKKKGRLKPGYDNSHIDPFSANGEGETFVEPATRNRARGAESVDFEEGNHEQASHQ